MCVLIYIIVLLVMLFIRVIVSDFCLNIMPFIVVSVLIVSIRMFGSLVIIVCNILLCRMDMIIIFGVRIIIIIRVSIVCYCCSV